MLEDVCNCVFRTKEEKQFVQEWLQNKTKSAFDVGSDSRHSRSPLISSDIHQSNVFSVIFQEDTDGKENFPNDASFHSFRKQRDMFYDMYHRWRLQNRGPVFDQPSPQNDRFDARFRFEESLRRIYALSTDSGNMYHLARLFVGQLIRSCIIGVDDMDSVEPLMRERDSSNLQEPNFRRKLKMLHRRMNSGSSKEQSIGTLFSSEEHFFYKFIQESKFVFHANLRLVILDRINQLNTPDSVFGFYDEEVENTVGQDNQKSKFISAVSTLMLLAKTLALIDFLPFNTQGVPSIRYSTKQAEIRSRFVSEYLNLTEMLRKSCLEQYLVLTMPWVLEYLKHADANAFNLPCFEVLLNEIFVCVHQLGLTSSEIYSNANKLFLIVSFSQFLENRGSHFLTKFLGKSRIEPASFVANSGLKCSLDSLSAIVDPVTIKEIFPKVIAPVLAVQSDETPEKPPALNKLTPRKIRPLALPKESTADSSSTSLTKLFTQDQDRKFQLRFEDNFINLHPSYVKKTIDFVSERISSRCIKNLKRDIISLYLQKQLESMPKDESDGQDHRQRCTSCMHSVYKQCTEYSHTFCEEEIKLILSGLLSDNDMKPEICKTAEAICTRICRETCCSWLKDNITRELLLSSCKFDKEKPSNINASKSSVPCFYQLFNRVRKLVALLLTNHQTSTSVQEISRTIEALKELRCYQGLPSKVYNFIDIIIIDLLLAVISSKPHYCEAMLLNLFYDYWLYFKLEVSNLLSPRNLFIIFHNSTDPLSWCKYEEVVECVSRKGLTDPKTIEAACLQTLKYNWDDAQLSKIAILLEAVVEAHKSTTGGKDTDLIEIMSWLAWFCSPNALNGS